MELEKLSLSEIWKLNTAQAIKLIDSLGITIPQGTSLQEIRDLLVKHKRSLLEAKATYENEQESSGYRSPDCNIYEEIDDFSSSSQHSSLGSLDVEGDNQINAMAVQQERLPFFHPGTFSGTAGESVEGFLVRFERAAAVNGWNEEKKKIYLPMYLTETSAVVYDNLERKHPRMTWREIKEEFQKTFSPVECRELVVAKLNARVQLPMESVIQYMADVERLCVQSDAGMEEVKICNHILKGLNPGALQQLSMFDNSTLAKLRENISKYEMSTYMMKQRLGLELPREPAVQLRDDGITKRMENVEKAMQQLQISLVSGGQERQAERGVDRELHYRSMEPNYSRRELNYGRTEPNRRHLDYSGDQHYNRRELNGFNRTRDGYYRREQGFRRDFHRGDFHDRDAVNRNQGRRGNDWQPSQRNRSRERSFSGDRGRTFNDPRNKGCFKCGSLEHFARGCRSNFSKN